MPLNNTTASLGYTELDPTTNVSTGVTGWVDWDLSAVVPAGVKRVEIEAWRDSAPTVVGVRGKGSGAERAQGALTGVVVSFSAVPDANRVVQIKNYEDAANNYRIYGYWA